MQMSAAMPSARSTIERASSSVLSSQGARGRLGVRAARADGDCSVLRLDDIAVAGYDEQILRIADQQQGLQAAQVAVRPPVLGELDRRASQVAVLLQLALEALEQRERVGGAAGEAGYHLAVGQAPHFAGVGLHDGVAERDLAVTAERDRVVAAYRQDGGGMWVECSIHRWVQPRRLARGCAFSYVRARCWKSRCV